VWVWGVWVCGVWVCGVCVFAWGRVCVSVGCVCDGGV
jgi:hypothetical protein